MGSIVATETSTVTFISVPGYAYGSNLTFLQLVMGYMIGRVPCQPVFIPAYFKGELLTVYQLLGDRFGGGVKRLASSALSPHAQFRGWIPALCHRARARRRASGDAADG